MRKAFALLIFAAACSESTGPRITPVDGPERLSARPIATTTTVPPDTYQLGIAANKDAVLVVPATATSAAVPLIVMLHGAGGDEPPVSQVVATAHEFGVAVLIPKSRQSTWDAAMGRAIGDDVAHINRALEETFSRVRVDPNRIALAGFSDGASYSLMIGIANGDLFSHVVAFAPGFMNPVNRFGRPRILIVHGTSDPITSAQNSEQNIAPFLRALGYSVDFHRFNGGHQVLAPESEIAVDWFLTGAL